MIQRNKITKWARTKVITWTAGDLDEKAAEAAAVVAEVVEVSEGEIVGNALTWSVGDCAEALVVEGMMVFSVSGESIAVWNPNPNP